MNLVIVTAAIAATLTVLAILALRAHRLRLANAAVVVMSFHAIFVLTFAMGGLRAHIEQAKLRGVSSEYVAGMVERDRFFLAPRIALGIGVFGLLVVSITATRRANRRSDEGGQNQLPSIHPVVREVTMKRTLARWFYALLCLSIFLRVAFLAGFKLYLGLEWESVDWIALPIGLVTMYLSYMYFRKIFERDPAKL